MKVSIVGPGAMGCLFAAYLAKSGAQTTLVDYKAERVARLKESGITVETQGGSFTAKPNVSLQTPTGQDLILVLVKAHVTRSLELPTDAPVLTLQNGLGNVEALCDLVSSSRVLAGTTLEAATLLDEGHVRRVASGLTKVGVWTSCPVETAAACLNSAGFEVEVTDTPGQMIWEKVAVNAGINPLTALLDVPNGRLVEMPDVRQLLRDLVVEAVKVASTEGYRFEQSLVEYAEAVCQQTSENVSSMLQDVRAGRRTEIEAMSGEILRRGQNAALPTPRTRVVYQLLKGIEQR